MVTVWLLADRLIVHHQRRAVAVSTEAGPPQRIVSISPAGDEYLEPLVPPRRVVALSLWPQDSKLAQQVSLRARADTEAVMALSPDFVVSGWLGSAPVERQLQRLGIPVLVLRDVASIGQASRIAEEVGRLFGAEETTAVWASPKTRCLGGSVRVLPLLDDNWSVGGGTLLDDVLHRAGAVNVVSDAGFAGYQRLGIEHLFAMDPDVILLMVYDDPRQPSRESDYGYLEQPPYDALRAIRSGAVVRVDARMMLTNSYRPLLGYTQVCEQLRPFAAGQGPA